jgi:hypothetical protein
MSHPVFRRRGSPTVKRFDMRSLFVFLIAAPLLACAAQKKPSYITVPVESLLDTFKGEQGDIIRQYGLPDRAFQGPLETMRWIYCSDPKGPLVIEFDTRGQILSRYTADDPNSCPPTSPGQP